MQRRLTLAALIGCLVVLGVFLAPLHTLPFFVRISYLDLALGAFSGGEWTAARIGLWAILLADIVAIIGLSSWLIASRARPNSALLTDTSTAPLRAQRGAAKRER
jgi:hypothetical protein